MDLSSYLIAALLALVQGITEFLPISSSAHLILPSQLGLIPDQGLWFDTAVHGGTWCAVMAYYRREVLAFFRLGRWKSAGATAGPQLACWLIIACLPVLVLGYLTYDLIAEHLRSTLVIALTTLVFAFLLWWAATRIHSKEQPTPRVLLLCGLAQVLALIPGVSRSGITLTVALAAGYKFDSAARISFLLAIPTIGAAFLYGLLQLIMAGDYTDLGLALWGAVLAGVFAYLTIGFFIALLPRIGITPFVIYRLILGTALLICAL